MIETIYSNEGGDTGKTNKVQNPFKMPKNIRQVGKSNTIKKIYVEDYVMTFIKQLAGGDYSGCKIAVLIGQCIRLENCRNIFISGAVEVKNIDTTGEIIFTNDIWTSIYEDIKKYFIEGEIVGWFIGGPGYLLEDEEKIQKIHVDNFAGQDKTLLTYDNMEREEAFFSFENNRLCKQEGYYIYYEKNEEMQTYMIECKNEQSGEASYDDRVSREIRAVIQNKKPPVEEAKSITRLMYAAGTLLAVIVLVVGAAILNNYDQMKDMQDTLNFLKRNMDEIQTLFVDNDPNRTMESVNDDSTGGETDISDDTDSTDATDAQDTSSSSEQSLNVEVVPGGVEPLETGKNQTNTEETTSNEDNNDENQTQGEDLAGETTTNTADTADAEPKEADTGKEETTDVQDEIRYYTVESGDTLADISFKLYNTYTKVKTIMKLNDIDNQDLIFVGQKLIIP